MPLAPGDTFDRYTIEALLGTGGIGHVYRAHDTRLRRRVALKVVGGDDPPSALGEGPDTARFLREARAAAAIDHPNAVSILDVGEVDGSPYVAMELVEGASLRAYVGDASIPPGRRVRWLRDIARALGAAHERGVMHGDLKPENVIVRADGTVKVLDFAIARLAPTSLASLAVAHRYASPEVLAGEPSDGRADQFAWGVLACELLTGRPPSPDGAMPDDIPRAVAAAIRTSMAPAPRDRFATMEDVAAALEPHDATPVIALASTEPPPPGFDPSKAVAGVRAITRAGPPPRAPRRWIPVAVMGLLAILVAGGVTAIARLRAGPVAPPDSAARIAVPTSATPAPPDAPPACDSSGAAPMCAP